MTESKPIKRALTVDEISMFQRLKAGAAVRRVRKYCPPTAAKLRKFILEAQFASERDLTL